MRRDQCQSTTQTQDYETCLNLGKHEPIEITQNIFGSGKGCRNILCDLELDYETNPVGLLRLKLAKNEKFSVGRGGYGNIVSQV